jgi:hypothetical protein
LREQNSEGFTDKKNAVVEAMKTGIQGLVQESAAA